MKKSTSSKSRSRTAASTPSRSRRKAPTQVMTLVSTSTITDSKIMIATLALFLASGLALIGVPVQNNVMQVAQVNAVAPKCGVNSFQVTNTCAFNRYATANVACHDGSEWVVGDKKVCTTRRQLSALAVDACQNRCAAPAPAVVPTPELIVSIDADTLLSRNLLMGSGDISLAKFDFTATGTEDIMMRDVVVSFKLSLGATSTLRGIRLYDGNNQIGPRVELSPRAQNSDYSNAIFRGVNLVVPRNQQKVLTVKADITDYVIVGLSGTRVQPVILSGDYDESTLGQQSALGAIGRDTGLTANITFRSNQGTSAVGSLTEALNPGLPTVLPGVGANQFVLYRAKLIVAWSGDTPVGATSPGAGQLIGKLVLSNMSNTGIYPATVHSVNFSFNSTIFNVQSRALNVYKESLQVAPLATTQFRPQIGVSSFIGSSGWEEREFGDFEIASGVNKTLFLTLDTTEARTPQTLSITEGIGFASGGSGDALNPVRRDVWNGIIWSDGVVPDIIAHDDLLPLVTKTLTY